MLDGVKVRLGHFYWKPLATGIVLPDLILSNEEKKQDGNNQEKITVHFLLHCCLSKNVVSAFICGSKTNQRVSTYMKTTKKKKKESKEMEVKNITRCSQKCLVKLEHAIRGQWLFISDMKKYKYYCHFLLNMKENFSHIWNR